MKLALLADVHSNLEALDACIAFARTRGAERFVFLGDLVGYNADPGAVLERVRCLMRDEGALAIMGNHDAAVAGESTQNMNDSAGQAILWTRTQLSETQRQFLAALPLVLRQESLLFVHANAAAPERWGYVHDGLRAAASLEATDATYVFCGHVHEPVLYYMGTDRRPLPFLPANGVPIPVGRHRRWLAIVGSCGQPRDGNPAASFVMFDTALRMMTFHRVRYDHAAAAAKVRQAGLPGELAHRLETGR